MHNNSVKTVEEKMLYCPKCNQKYEDGKQRFCNNDGGRLLPETSVRRQTGIKDKSVFTDLLGRTKPRSEKDEKLASRPGFVKAEQANTQFEPPKKSKIFKTPPIFESQTDKFIQDKKAVPVEKDLPKIAKPLSRLIDPKEVRINQAELGDRHSKPIGRAALNWENAEILIGETIKGRYRITEKLEQDSSGIAYLADDKIIHGKKAIVRVLMDENSRENLEDKIFAEERVSLSHINHPNIAKFIDSGELPEGKPFIVTEFIEGESVRDILNKGRELNPMRVARIIGQTSYALSEVHQNGILHRNLKPENILLTVSESGKEQVKVKDFCVSDGDLNTDFAYKAPEQIGGQLPTFSSDTYSLGVIAYEMLTGQMPFEESSARALLKSQKKNLNNKPSELKADLPELVDNIVEKALAFNASERYPKARDFGDALYNSLTTVSPWNEKTEDNAEIAEVENKSLEDTAPLESSEDFAEEISAESVEPINSDSFIHIPSTQTNTLETEEDVIPFEVEGEKTQPATATNTVSAETLWEKRSPEPTREGNKLFTLLSVLGLLILFVSVVGSWRYFENYRKQTAQVAAPNQT
ncbi:MAG: serine/threonine protein kinase, partial [Aridibacter sp.]